MFGGWQPAKNILNLDERRRAPRYMGKLPVEMERGTGLTRDFSAVGVFFITERSAPIGSPIEFLITLDHSDLGYSYRIRCKGLVMRVEPTQGKAGVAVAIHSHSFEGLLEPEDMPEENTGKE